MQKIIRFYRKYIIYRGFLSRRLVKKIERTNYYIIFRKTENYEGYIFLITIHKRLIRKSKEDSSTDLFVEGLNRKFKAYITIPYIIAEEIIKT
jgi:hypothetical protein